MKPLAKIIRAIYPFLIWFITINGALVLVFLYSYYFEPLGVYSKSDPIFDEFLKEYILFFIVSTGFSLPALITFVVTYYTCTVRNFSAFKTKKALLIMNVTNIFLTVFIMSKGEWKFLLFGGGPLFICSNLAILLIKIPPKVEE